MNFKHVLMTLAISGATAFAANNTTSTITSALCGINSMIKAILPTIALAMFLLAGLAYAAGQAFGAETKGRAQNWAMSLLVGGIIGLVLAILAPTIVGFFAGTATGLGSLPC